MQSAIYQTNQYRDREAQDLAAEQRTISTTQGLGLVLSQATGELFVYRVDVETTPLEPQVYFHLERIPVNVSAGYWHWKKTTACVKPIQ